MLEHFVPRARRGQRLRDAYSVTIDELSGNQERLFEFMQFVKRRGAVRYLQLLLSLDELNRELFGAAISESGNGKRLRRLHEELTDIVRLAKEGDVAAALEATVDLEALERDVNVNASVDFLVSCLHLPSLLLLYCSDRLINVLLRCVANFISFSCLNQD